MQQWEMIALDKGRKSSLMSLISFNPPICPIKVKFYIFLVRVNMGEINIKMIWKFDSSVVMA